jgi:hypothetical protein
VALALPQGLLAALHASCSTRLTATGTTCDLQRATHDVQRYPLQPTWRDQVATIFGASAINFIPKFLFVRLAPFARPHTESVTPPAPPLGLSHRHSPFGHAPTDRPLAGLLWIGGGASLQGSEKSIAVRIFAAQVRGLWE